MATIQDYIEILDAQIHENERYENYEICADLLERKQAIQERNLEKFVSLFFDIPLMKKAGFIPKKATKKEVAERIKQFFGLESVFDYVTLGIGVKVHITV